MKKTLGLLVGLMLFIGAGCANKPAEINQPVANNVYTNTDHKFSFTIPNGWEVQREEDVLGEFRVILNEPNFTQQHPSANIFDLLTINISNNTFDSSYQLLEWNISKESEEKITVDGREAVKRVGLNELGDDMVVVIIPNGDHTIELYLRTTEKPYSDEFETLLKSFKFNE